MNRIKPRGRGQGTHRSQYSSRSQPHQRENTRDPVSARYPTSSNSGNVTSNFSTTVPQTGGNSILSMVAESLSKNNINGGYQYLQPGWFNNSSSSSEFSTNYNNNPMQGYGYQAPTVNNSYGQSPYCGGDDSTLIGLEQRMAEIQKELDTLQQEEIMEQSQATARPFPDYQTFFQDPATQERREKELAKMDRILQQQHGIMRNERPQRPPSHVKLITGSSGDYRPERVLPPSRKRSPPLSSLILPPARSPPRRRDNHREPSWKSGVERMEKNEKPRRLSPPQKRRRIEKEETSRHTSVSSNSRRSEKKEEPRRHTSRRRDSPRRHSRASSTQPKEHVRRESDKEAPKQVIKLDRLESSRLKRALEDISVEGLFEKVPGPSGVVDSNFGEPIPTEGPQLSLGELLKEMRLRPPPPTPKPVSLSQLSKFFLSMRHPPEPLPSASPVSAPPR